MTFRLDAETLDPTFPENIFPDHAKVMTCIQCGTCTASCPTAHAMDHNPRQVIRMVQLGMRDELLHSSAFWYCTTCYSCTLRCPRGISITETMQGLKRAAIRQHVEKKTNSSRFYLAFLETVYRTGRMAEVEVVARWLLRTNPLQAFQFTSMGIALLLRGRMPLIPKTIRGVGEVQAMLDKADEIAKRGVML